LQLEEGVYVPTGNVVDDYFVFRTKFLALAAVLGKTVWAIEYLCQWHQRRPPSERAPHLSAQQLGAPRFMPRRSRPLRAIGGRLSPALRLVAERPLVAQVRRARAANAVDEHTHWQWQLATIGRSLGCQVWIASNDHSKSWNGESLGALSIDRLPPLGMDADSQRLIQLIDVVWLRGTNQVVAAFEVERTEFRVVADGRFGRIGAQSQLPALCRRAGGEDGEGPA
jgi:hypothetical protein